MDFLSNLKDEMQSTKFEFPLPLARLFFGAKVRADAWELIADLMDSGLEDNRAIESAAYMFRLRGKAAAAAVLSDLATSIGSGAFVEKLGLAARGAEALVFSNVGTVAGPVVFRGAARIVRNEQTIRTAILEAMAKPALLVVSLVGLFVMMGLNLFPAFETIAPRKDWAASTQTIASVSDWLISSGYWGLAAVLVLVVAVAVSQPHFVGTSRAMRVIRGGLDYLPPWSFYRLRTGAAFAFAIVEVARAGGTLNSATLSRMSRMGSKYSAVHVDAIAKALLDGANLGEAFQAGGKFPDPELNAVMAVLAGQPNALEKFGTYTDRWILAAEKSVKQKAAVINALLLVALTGVIVSIILAILGIMSSVQG